MTIHDINLKLAVFHICSGESYGGIFVPTLVHTIMKMNENILNPGYFMNLKGFMVCEVKYCRVNVNCSKYSLTSDKSLCSDLN